MLTGMDEWRRETQRLEQEIAGLREEIDRLKKLVPAAPSLRELLLRRGVTVVPDAGQPPPLLPAEEEQVARYYSWMRRYSFRIFMRDVTARPRGMTARTRWKYISATTARRYLAALTSVGILDEGPKGQFILARHTVTSFGPTLEWFVTEVLRREFHLPAERGLQPVGLAAGGDYDILAAAGTGIVYLEVKSSPPKHIDEREATAFARRVEALKPQAAIFLVDTQLRLRDKIVPLLRQALASPRPDRLKEGVYRFPGPTFALSSRKSLIHNLRFALEDLFREEVLY